MSLMLVASAAVKGVAESSLPGGVDWIFVAVGATLVAYGAYCLARLVRVYPWLSAWRDYNLKAMDTLGMPRIALDGLPRPFAAFDPGNHTLESMARNPEEFRRLKEWVRKREAIDEP